MSRNVFERVSRKTGITELEAVIQTIWARRPTVLFSTLSHLLAVLCPIQWNTVSKNLIQAHNSLRPPAYRQCRKNPFSLIRPDLVEEFDQVFRFRLIMHRQNLTDPKILVRLNQVRQGLVLKTIFATKPLSSSRYTSPLKDPDHHPPFINNIHVLFYSRLLVILHILSLSKTFWEPKPALCSKIVLVYPVLLFAGVSQEQLTISSIADLR